MKNIPKTIAILIWTIPTLLMLFSVLIYINDALATRILANSSYPPPGEQYVVTPDSYQNYKVVLPLIYATSGENADQWFSLSAYAYDAHGARMDVKGAVTQYQACQQTGTWCHENNVDNTPAEGYRQLWLALNADSDTAQQLLWATDMKWK